MTDDEWTVREFIATEESSKWLWEQMQNYRTLFTDVSRNNPNSLWDAISGLDTYWMEIHRGDERVGVFYLTDIRPGEDATVHVMFFDRKMSDKVGICQMMLGWVFNRFKFHRVTAMMPSIYFSTIRLAKRVGFKQEGVRREVYLISDRWVDEVLFGILKHEVGNGR